MSHLRFGQSEDDWRYFHNISIHHVDDSLPWPRPVRHLAQFFDAPLPGWLVTGPHPYVSEDSSDLLCDVLRQSVEDPSILLDYSCTDPAAHPISKAFDLISSSVAILRQIKSRQSPGEHRITTPLWTSMISAVSRVCMPECVSTGETRFALPRVAHPESHPFVQLEAQEGLATLLISYVGDITLSTDAEECDEQSDIVDDPMSVDSDAEAEPRESLQEEDEEDGGNSQDLFYNAHVLKPPSDSAVMVPIICVAHPEEIIPLLASVLYQRWIWDIVEPVVGITFPKTGAVGQVIFAWLGPTDGSGVDLPIVNLSFGSCRKVHHDHGIFDLSDAVSALRLSNFLSNLSEHFSKIRSATDQRGRLDESALARKSWRADLVEKPFSGSWEERERRIDMWRRTVPDSRITDPFSPLDAEMPPKRNTGTSPSVQITDSGGNTNSQTKHSTKSSKRPKFYSCSSYAILDDNGIVDGSSMTNWLLERRALPVARIEGGNKEINEMIKLYNDYTELRWPAEWASEDKLPPVDAGVDSLRKALFLSGKACGVPLSKFIFKIIRHRLSSLLWAADGASSRHVRAQNTGALEADRRHDWDALFLRFFPLPADHHVDVLMERMLHLARNPVHDLVGGDVGQVEHVGDELRKLAATYMNHCNEEETQTEQIFKAYRQQLKDNSDSADLDAKHRNAKDLYAQALAAHQDASDQYHGLGRRDLMKDEDVLQSLVARSTEEPHTGTCDAVGVVGIPDFLLGSSVTDKSLALDFCFIQRPTAESTASAQAGLSQSNPLRSQSVESGSDKLQVPDRVSGRSRKRNAEDQDVQKKPTRVFDAVEISSRYEERKQDHPKSAIRDPILQLPILLVEHKKLDPKKVDQAANQSRHYGVSATIFLKTIGIYDFPVFGLITDGPIGVVSCTWYSKNHDCIYVMERNGRAFDIRTPLGAYHCATFFATLATQHVPNLRQKYSDAEKDFKGCLGDETKREKMMWIKSRQCKEYNLHPKSKSKSPTPESSPSLTDVES